jgi:ATP-dependent Lon protease
MVLKKAKRAPELRPEDMKWICPPESLDFKTTKELKPTEQIIGQERAVSALKIGVELWSPGYNIYIAGLSGTGKATTVQKILETIRPKCPVLNDYAYVNNFKDPDQPTLLMFPKGQAGKFKKDMGTAIHYLQRKIPQALEAAPFIAKKKKILAEYSDEEQKLMASFEEKIQKDNFSMGQVKVGEFARPDILPIVDNKPIAIQQLDETVREGKITKEQANNITQKYAVYQEELQSIFKKGIKISQEFGEKIDYLEREAVSAIVAGTFESMKEKYKAKKIAEYLDHVQDSILDTLDIFKGKLPGQDEDGLIADYYKNYEVNIVLDNANVKECPIIIETTPTFNNLFGTIEKINDGRGGWYADFTKIKAGSLLRANGGYLVLNAQDAFQEPGVWKSLKRVLMYGTLEIQDYWSSYQFSPSVLKPECINVNTKVILIGSQYLYSMLTYYEDDFKKIFKIKADFDYQIDRSDDLLKEYSRVIKTIIQKEKLMDFDNKAISAIFEYSVRYAGEKDKLTTRFSFISDLLRESNYWASKDGVNTVKAEHVTQAYESGRERHGLYESKLNEMISKGTILIDTDGERAGQINGLAVYGSDYFSFGKPMRLTATVSLGPGNIINVERESGLSGNTHDKGILIIAGYFRENFGRKMPLAFTASIVFEQGYGPIDGDSASSTEICALLSCISGLPIKQHFAITGSVNQKGDIQPIGGVNEKIEGFFDVCKQKGFNKKHGVIIPAQNVKDLMLKNEIIEEAAKGNFHIYPVTRIEEAIELLTGIEAGIPGKNGSYPDGTVFGLVERKLKEMREAAKPLNNNVNKNGKQPDKKIQKRRTNSRKKK